MFVQAATVFAILLFTVTHFKCSLILTRPKPTLSNNGSEKDIKIWVSQKIVFRLSNRIVKGDEQVETILTC